MLATFHMEFMSNDIDYITIKNWQIDIIRTEKKILARINDVILNVIVHIKINIPLIIWGEDEWNMEDMGVNWKLSR